jgi:hypothetical protein
MNKRQFRLNGYVSLFGNYSEALFIYSKFGNIKHYSESGFKLSNLNTKLVNKIMLNRPLLAGSNYAFLSNNSALESNFDNKLINLLFGHDLFVRWLEKNNFKSKFGLQNFIVSGLVLDLNMFNVLSKPLNFHLQSNSSLLNSSSHLDFSNNLKMYLIFPIVSLTLLNFLKLLLNPLKITFGFLGFVKMIKK